MRGRDWFVVGIRLIGFWFLVKPLGYGASMLDIAVNQLERPGATPLGGYLIYIIADLICGIVLVRFAEGIGNICYGHPRSSDEILRDLRRFDGDDEEEVGERIT
jgi:hypothetical protein